MKYTIDEEPVALKFALLRLPDKFIDGQAADSADGSMVR